MIIFLLGAPLLFVGMRDDSETTIEKAFYSKCLPVQVCFKILGKLHLQLPTLLIIFLVPNRPPIQKNFYRFDEIIAI